MFAVILAIHIIIAVLLIIMVLVQQSQGGGLSGVFGGMGSNMFGGSGGASFMIKTTSVLAGLFGLTTILLVLVGGRRIPGSAENIQQYQSTGSGDIELQPYVSEMNVTDTAFSDSLEQDSLSQLLTGIGEDSASQDIPGDSLMEEPADSSMMMLPESINVDSSTPEQIMDTATLLLTPDSIP
ncbi:MAG: hypothetical protein APR63_07550 [Desulfuromonas sp. SDB]|nr:MAG: hypothetical protein APR63_07550 [Desulfuromonas sp. SDB]